MSVQVQLPPEVVSIVGMIVVDSRIESLKIDLTRLMGLQSPLAAPVKAAYESLTNALKAYVEEQNRAVRVVSPAEVPRLVQS